MPATETRYRVLKLYGWWYGLCPNCSGVVKDRSQPGALAVLEKHANEECKKA